MKEYRYTLDRSSKKFICQNCGKKRLVRYVDSTTANYLPEKYGSCDRKDNCGYHLNPYSDGFNANENCTYPEYKPATRLFERKKKLPSYIPESLLNHTLKNYEGNFFIRFLQFNAPYPFLQEILHLAIELYKIGTISKGYLAGATAFPFIDINNNIRTIQIKLFDKSNHTVRTSFLHAYYKAELKKKNSSIPSWLQDYEKNDLKVSCLFGEHLLKRFPDNPVALVEAPKTAFYGTLFFGLPDNPNNFLWLAVFNRDSITLEKCKALEGRQVVLFPDLSKTGSTFELWTKKAREFSENIPDANFIVSDLIENTSSLSEKIAGLDLADFLIGMDWRAFHENDTSRQELEPYSRMPFGDYPTDFSEVGFVKSSAPCKDETVTWDIDGLENFFSSINTIHLNTIDLESGLKITEMGLFVEGHLAAIKFNKGNKTFTPYYNRLVKLKLLLEQPA